MPLPVILQNLAFICSMCERMAAAHEKGLEDCGHPECGGLPKGKTFPAYKGPLQPVLLEYCHRCGRDSTQIMEVSGAGRLGICKHCLEKILDNEEAQA